ncbi:MAG: hypothetical protein ABSB88_18725 [Bryobacteraceae bacterium]
MRVPFLTLSSRRRHPRSTTTNAAAAIGGTVELLESRHSKTTEDRRFGS